MGVTIKKPTTPNLEVRYAMGSPLRTEKCARRQTFNLIGYNYQKPEREGNWSIQMEQAEQGYKSHFQRPSKDTSSLPRTNHGFAVLSTLEYRISLTRKGLKLRNNEI